MTAKITAQLNLDSNGFKVGIDKSKQELSGFSKGMKSLSVGVTSSFAAIGPALQMAMLGATGIAITAGAAIGAAIRKGIPAALESLAADDTLATALKNNVNLALEAVKPEIEKLGKEFQLKFGFGDEDTKAGLAQLLDSGMQYSQAMGKMGLVADVAAKKNMTMADAAKVVGLAAQGNTRGLRELGIIVESTGDSAQDAAIALAKLQQVAGGSAELQGKRNPFLGLAESAGELFETIGMKLLPVMQEIAPEFTTFLTDLGASGGLAEKFGETLANGIRTAWLYAKGLLEDVRFAYDFAQTFLGNLGGNIAKSFEDGRLAAVLIDSAVAFSEMLWAGIKLVGKMAVNAFFNGLPLLVATLGKLLVDMLSQALGPKLSGTLGLDKASKYFSSEMTKQKDEGVDTLQKDLAAFKQQMTPALNKAGNMYSNLYGDALGGNAAMAGARAKRNERQRLSDEAEFKKEMQGQQDALNAANNTPAAQAENARKVAEQQWRFKRSEALGAKPVTIQLEQREPTHRVNAAY